MENRKRVGMMMPSADGTAEPDFQMVLGPKGVACTVIGSGRTTTVTTPKSTSVR